MSEAKGSWNMKKTLFSALAAFGLALGASAAGELVATGADVRAWRLGEVGGGALTDASVGVRRTVCPWKLYVTNAVRRATTTESVFTPTNYIVRATVTVTNAVPTWSDFTKTVTNVVFQTDAAATSLAYATVTNVYAVAGTRLSLTNTIASATVTNAVLSLAGLAAPWEVVSTNGVTSTATNHTTAAAGGTVTLKNSFGDTWTLNLSGGAASTNATPDLAKLVFAGDLKLSASQAERLDFRMVYLTFQQ